jgi:hypothetical protein
MSTASLTKPIPISRRRRAASSRAPSNPHERLCRDIAQLLLNHPDLHVMVPDTDTDRWRSLMVMTTGDDDSPTGLALRVHLEGGGDRDILGKVYLPIESLGKSSSAAGGR